MNTLISKFVNHADLYKLASVLGASTTLLYNLFVGFSEKELFGVTLFIWFLLFCVNIVDISTGIKADRKRKADLGTNFKFESSKGWRAIEKVALFTIVIGFLYFFEKEIIKNEYPEFLSGLFVGIKLTIFFYAFLIELQSIGENEETRFGYKSRMFNMLDKIIEAINEGVITTIKNYFRRDHRNPNNPRNEEEFYE